LGPVINYEKVHCYEYCPGVVFTTFFCILRMGPVSWSVSTTSLKNLV
jgi:hypothetical protein